MSENMLRKLVRQACAKPCKQNDPLNFEVPYQPETWRYGNNQSLKVSESFFHIDSNHVLDLLATLGDDADEQSLVFAATLSCIATIQSLTDNIKEALALCIHTQNFYGEKRKNIKQLAKRFNNLQENIKSKEASPPG